MAEEKDNIAAGLNPDGTEKTTFTKEDVEAMKKSFFDKDEGVQKVLKQNKLNDTVHDEIKNISEKGKEHLIDLYSDNEDVAKIILDKYYEGQSIEDFKKSIDYTEDATDPKVIARMVESEAKKLASKKLISDKKDEFITKLKMTDEEKKDFEEAFDERTQLKTFSVKNLDKHFEKAYRDVNDNTESLKEMKKQEAIANALATGNNKGGKQTTTQKETNIKKNSEYNKNFLKERGIL